MDSALAALLGAAIGGGATLGASYLLARNTSRQERTKMATQLAAKEHDYDMLRRREDPKYNQSLIAEYVLFYAALLRKVDKGREVTLDDLTKLANRYGVAE